MIINYELLKEKWDLLVDVAVGFGMIEINLEWGHMIAEYFSMDKLEGYSKVFGMLAGGIYFVFRIIAYYREAKAKKIDIHIKQQQLKDLKDNKCQN